MQIYALVFEARREKLNPEVVFEMCASSELPCSCCRSVPWPEGIERRSVLLEPHVGHLDLPVNIAAIPGALLGINV